MTFRTLALAAAFVLLPGCTVDVSDNDAAAERAARQAAQAEAVVEAFANLWNSHDSSSLTDFTTADFVRITNGQEDASSRQQMTQFIDAFFTGFPDLTLAIGDSWFHDGKYFVYWTFAGTNSGEFAGVPATGKRVSFQGVAIGHVNEDGKLFREDVFFDQSAMMQQLGYRLTPPASL